jgi:hypothetical protein
MVHWGSLQRCLFRASLKDTYTLASTANNIKDDLHFPNTLFVTALYKITEGSKTKAELEQEKMDAAAFVLTPSP